MDRRLKSKMKKCDPESFSIHDFLNEGKSSDAADTRFAEEDCSGEVQKFFVVGGGGKVGSLTKEIANILTETTGWKQKKDSHGRYHLVLGGNRGSGISWKSIGQFKWDFGIIPHCNCFRGYIWLTQKTKLIQVLRVGDIADLMPESYLFFPSTSEDNEIDGLRAAFEGGSKRGSTDNTWIIKSADGTRGEKTFLMDNFDQIVEFLESQEQTSAPWAIQRYISNPLLLPGGKKFDLRFFVLLDSRLNPYIATEAVCKTCPDSFSLDDLTNTMAHLSIPGKNGANQMPVEQLAKWLSSEHGVNYEQAVMTPVRETITKVLAASRPKLENVEHAEFTSFQVFAFDFLVDANLKVWFAEVSAVSSMPEQMVHEAAKDIFSIAIQPLFQEDEESRDGKKHSFFMPLVAETRVRNNKK